MAKALKRSGTRSPSPQAFLDDLWAARRSLALAAAVELDVFTPIDRGQQTAAAVAGALNVPPRGIERLLDALVGMDYLAKTGPRYRLMPVADAFLVRDRQAYLGAMADETRMTVPGWMQLAEVIRTGRPVASADVDDREFFPRLVRAIFPVGYASAQVLVGAMSPATLRRIGRVLDVAAGAAPWSIAFATRLPEARVTVVDYPEVTAVSREYASMFGVADRFEYLEGDLREIDVGKELYDLVILGHIIHGEGARRGRELLARSHRALKPGGTLVIAEIMPNDARKGPVFPLLFGLNMLVHTGEGDVFTLKQYRQWLKEIGFRAVRTLDARAPSPLILATRSKRF